MLVQNMRLQKKQPKPLISKSWGYAMSCLWGCMPAECHISLANALLPQDPLQVGAGAAGWFER